MPGKLGQLITLEEPQLQAVEESGGWNTEHSIIRGKLHRRIGRFKAALCKEAGGCGARKSNRKLGKRWRAGSTTCGCLGRERQKSSE